MFSGSDLILVLNFPFHLLIKIGIIFGIKLKILITEIEDIPLKPELNYILKEEHFMFCAGGNTVDCCYPEAMFKLMTFILALHLVTF
jgi:hypothetical protein